jgi:hypothetical protein
MDLPMFGADWRMRWWQTPRRQTLHRVAAISFADDDRIWGHGATACGMFAELHMPGIFSRMGAPRCALCCAVVGLPAGNGAPFNAGLREPNEPILPKLKGVR